MRTGHSVVTNAPHQFMITVRACYSEMGEKIVRRRLGKTTIRLVEERAFRSVRFQVYSKMDLSTKLSNWELSNECSNCGCGKLLRWERVNERNPN